MPVFRLPRISNRRGALPPAFGSPRDICGQMKEGRAFICLSNIPGVRGLAPGTVARVER